MTHPLFEDYLAKQKEYSAEQMDKFNRFREKSKVRYTGLCWFSKNRTEMNDFFSLSIFSHQIRRCQCLWIIKTSMQTINQCRKSIQRNQMNIIYLQYKIETVVHGRLHWPLTVAPQNLFFSSYLEIFIFTIPVCKYLAKLISKPKCVKCL